MGLDFCSAPATSVDAERAFSHGRHQVNFTQHNMSSNTFVAQMAVGSWDNTPLFPDLTNAFNIIEAKISRLNTS
ncbi:uncharacterized protein FOMMEDRAFT_86151 [Fomitiporia mediterranea MF3/22]|uniref:uncharacterized protein n=1 Tax=Fomitiporia mediterranea (strain MF3/22) TaxID=694068 RepID=UPI0004409CA9|nr:uncharacterized protein FOMMEDRAFT_86151 [Fomitiporia mediterranea MF3/22]EJD02901.1 hypothetical protein FOMMEDRAFT_86151 [Fomitiporia mediterranea MF3/22]